MLHLPASCDAPQFLGGLATTPWVTLLSEFPKLTEKFQTLKRMGLLRPLETREILAGGFPDDDKIPWRLDWQKFLL